MEKLGNEKHVTTSISFDGIRINLALKLYTMYGAIFGGAEPKPFISVINIPNEEIQAKLDPKPDIEQSGEINVSVVAIKNIAKAELTYLCLCWSRSTNQHILQLQQECYAHMHIRMQILRKEASVVDYGVICDISFIKSALCDFLLVKFCHVVLVDSNKNGKTYATKYWVGHLS